MFAENKLSDCKPFCNKPMTKIDIIRPQHSYLPYEYNINYPFSDTFYIGKQTSMMKVFAMIVKGLGVLND